VWSLLTAVAQSPTLAAASAALLSGAVLFALWVLYRNVFSSHLGERGYAQPSL
jgi:hypothetical protein